MKFPDLYIALRSFAEYFLTPIAVDQLLPPPHGDPAKPELSGIAILHPLLYGFKSLLARVVGVVFKNRLAAVSTQDAKLFHNTVQQRLDSAEKLVVVENHDCLDVVGTGQVGTAYDDEIALVALN